MYGILVMCLLLRQMGISSDNNTTTSQSSNDYTTASQPSNDLDERQARDGDYIGCYPQDCLDVNFHAVLSIATTPDTCTATCKESGFKIAALYNRTGCACFCEQRCPAKQVDNSNCGLPCRHDLERFCGGFTGASFYDVKSVKTSKSKCSENAIGGTDATTTKATTSTSSTRRAMNTATKHRNITSEHTTTTVTTSELTRSSPRSTSRDSTTTALLNITVTEPLVSISSRLETHGPSVHIAIPILISVVIFLIIIIAVILTYHHLKYASLIRVTERANGQLRDRGLWDKSVHGATSRSLNAMPRSHKMLCTPGPNPSVENALETSVGEVLYENPDKNVNSASKPDSKLSHEFLVPSQSVLLENSSLDHDFNNPDMPDVGLVQAPVSARSTDEEGYIVMDRDPQGRAAARSKVYYSSRIPRSQGGMGSSKITGSEGCYSLRIPQLLKKKEIGSVEDPDSHVYYSADSAKACDDYEEYSYMNLYAN